MIIFLKYLFFGLSYFTIFFLIPYKIIRFDIGLLTIINIFFIYICFYFFKKFYRKQYIKDYRNHIKGKKIIFKKKYIDFLRKLTDGIYNIENAKEKDSFLFKDRQNIMISVGNSHSLSLKNNFIYYPLIVFYDLKTERGHFIYTSGRFFICSLYMSLFVLVSLYILVIDKINILLLLLDIFLLFQFLIFDKNPSLESNKNIEDFLDLLIKKRTFEEINEKSFKENFQIKGIN